MDISTKAIALKSVDYGENDKIILLYSLEYGKISVRAKGIKKPKAKLKFCQEPFCLGVYELAAGHGYYVLKTCQQLESFYSLREDIVCFYGGCVVLECLTALQPEEPDARLFVEALKTFDALTAGVNAYIAVLYFLLQFLKQSGYELNFAACSVCGDNSQLYLDPAVGGVVCKQCKGEGAIALSAGTGNLLKLVSSMTSDKLANIRVPDAVSKEAVHSLSSYIAVAVQRLKSATEFIRL